VTLVLNRIDDRLIHGQVVVGWGQPLDVKFIVLVDDAVATSDWEQELYRMGVPPEMEVRFHSIDEAAPLLDAYRTETHPGILLTGDIATMSELVRRGGVREVNVGGIHHRAGRKQYLRYVFLTAEEQRALRDVAALGALVTAQDVPAARAVPLDEMLANGEAGS
jgi:mannose/fructose/N-acetylgalactosamine-specific phosphotransferase system component IIB